VRLHKRLTTPHDPSAAALLGLEELVAMGGIGLGDVSEIIHGTTLVTNAVIERKGAKVGLITTQGFRDILEMGTEQRYDIYDLFLGFPEPLVSRDLRLEVMQRLDRDGNTVMPLNEEDIRAAFRKLLDERVKAVGVCLINAFCNPVHEQAIGRTAREEFPELAVSLCAEAVAKLWEYQRAVTICANAYVQPLMDRYLKRLGLTYSSSAITSASSAISAAAWR